MCGKWNDSMSHMSARPATRSPITRERMSITHITTGRVRSKYPTQSHMFAITHNEIADNAGTHVNYSHYYRKCQQYISDTVTHSRDYAQQDHLIARNRHMKRDVHIWKVSYIYMKETCVYEKKRTYMKSILYIYERDLCIWKETCTYRDYAQRDHLIARNRHMKRDVHI